jgi:hypothetical protein
MPLLTATALTVVAAVVELTAMVPVYSKLLVVGVLPSVV